LKKLFSFPKPSAFGKVLAKSKIFEHTVVKSKIKKLFVSEVEKITWSYKLSPATINLPASEGVHEIQVFTIALKTSELSHEVLETIDKAIPSPIFFSLQFKGKTRYVAAYKRPSEADKSKWVISSYFESRWIRDDVDRKELPIVLDMGGLYKEFLKSLIPLDFKKSETLDELVLRTDKLRAKEREAIKLESSIGKEKQFNRKVELNRSLNDVKQEIETLKR